MSRVRPNYTVAQQNQMDALAQSFQTLNAGGDGILPIEDFHEDQA